MVEREQVADQCKVVRHLALALAEIHGDYEKAMRGGEMDQIIKQVGRRTARLMETLGNVINGMDAATEDDEWMQPIFEEAQRVWSGKQQLEEHQRP